MALNILAKSIIEIRAAGEKGELLAISPYLPSLVAVSKNRLKDDPQAKWVVQFHPFVTRSIDQVTYRQFNYDLMMKHSTQLARWLHKQLVLKYTFAELSKPFDMRYSTIKRDSGLLNSYSRERAAIDALDNSPSKTSSRKTSFSAMNEKTSPGRGRSFSMWCSRSGHLSRWYARSRPRTSALPMGRGRNR